MSGISRDVRFLRGWRTYLIEDRSGRGGFKVVISDVGVNQIFKYALWGGPERTKTIATEYCDRLLEYKKELDAEKYPEGRHFSFTYSFAQTP